MQQSNCEPERPSYKIHLVLGLAVLMMLVPTFLYLAGPLRSPIMVEGDSLGEHTCPDCQGAAGDCRRCHKTGKIPHVFPGPNRPVQIVGHLYGPDGQPVSGAAVAIKTSAGDIEVKSDERGMFGATLPPGKYAMAVTPSQPPESNSESSEILVEALKAPIPADRDLGFTLEHRPFQLHLNKK